MLPRRRRFSHLLHRLYTEADTPSRQAAAVGLGLFIGCTPFFGFHLLLSVLVGSLLRLNRLKVYIPANISNPWVAPFLLAVELQVGSWVTGGSWYWPTFSEVRLWGVAQNLLVGSLVVGVVVGLAGAAVTYAAVSRRRLSAGVADLIERASERYLEAGFHSWQFASGKLRLDPVYREVLEQGILPRSGTLVDGGCGQGLMLALLATARECHARGQWPEAWPEPPSTLALHGIDSRQRVVRKARLALGDDATIQEGDLREISFPSCDVALLLDVVHLMPQREQDDLLGRVREALRPGGLLILREADAAAGLGFRAVRIGNWLTRAVQGQWRRRFHFRTAGGWGRDLTAMGFEVSSQPMGWGTPFANVLLYARRLDEGTPSLYHVG